MRRMIAIALVALGAATLSGCGGGPPIRYYTVELPVAPAQPASGHPYSLLIGHIAAPEILREEPIAYRTGKNEIGIYQYHFWVEPPVQMLRITLVRMLRSSGKYQSVTELGSSAQGDYVLQGRLYDFEEVDSAGGIAALVSMEFDLVDGRSRKTVWTHFYSHSEPVQGEDLPDVVSALDHNLTQGLNELESGLDGYIGSSAQAPGKS